MEKPDQADLVAQNEKLTADLATANKTAADANAQVETLKGEKATLAGQVAEAQKGSNTLQETLSARTKERDDAKAEVEKLKASQSNFDAKLRAELVKHGIRQSAVPAEIMQDKKMTATEKCLAANAK